MDKKRREFVQAAVVVGTGAILLNGLGCGDDTDTDAGGGTDTGGTDGGGTDTGGTDTGGTDTGGTDTGGTDTGGTDTGGTDTGGTDTGGTDTGGTDAGAACETVVTMIGTNHRMGPHSVEVPAADVATGTEQMYSIAGRSRHDHMITVTAANFASLAAGENVSVMTAADDTAHSHEVTLTCGVA